MSGPQTELFRSRPTLSLPQRILDRRRRGATFVDHDVRTLINPPESTGMDFWSVNPYVGCEFGCTYCYARYAHQFVVDRAHRAGQVSSEQLERFRASKRWAAFEEQIFVKRHDAVLAALERDLLSVLRRHHRGVAQPIVIGTATDPYQPAETRFEITRAVLRRLRRERGLTIGIITKSPTICRDAELLLELQQRHRVTVYISLITTDPRIIRLFEARSPLPHARLRALKRLTDAGVNAGLIVAPILPGITDTVPRLRALVEAVKRANGRFAHPSPLRLYPALHHGFLPIVREHFPELYPRYRRAYRGAGSAPKHYTDAVVRRFKAIMREYGVAVEDPVLDRPACGGRAQLALRI